MSGREFVTRAPCSSTRQPQLEKPTFPSPAGALLVGRAGRAARQVSTSVKAPGLAGTHTCSSGSSAPQVGCQAPPTWLPPIRLPRGPGAQPMAALSIRSQSEEGPQSARRGPLGATLGGL